MYFTIEKHGDVVQIICAISGRYWKYVAGSKQARQQAESAAAEWQRKLLEDLKNRAGLSRKFHTFTEIEDAYERFRSTSPN